MEFRLLGPLEIESDGRVITIGAERLRALLSILLLSANRVVTTDQIADEMWDGEPPDGSRTSVRTYISQLRKALRPIGVDTRIVTQPPGYLVRVEPGELDLDRFTAAATTGRALLGDDPVAAAEILRGAVEIWRGPALLDVGDSHRLRSAADRLEQSCYVTIEDRLEADLARGAHHEAIPDIEALLAAQPLRERLWQQLIVARYRAGRQTEALAAYREVQEVLAEHGLEPSPELRELEVAVLRHDPALQVPARANAVEGIPVDLDLDLDVDVRAAFVGRDEELGRLQAAWHRAVATASRQLVLVAGEPGIGKTALCAHLATRLAGEGAAVVTGRCLSEAVVPYQPVIEALRAYARSVPAAELKASLGLGAVSLARLIPELDDGAFRQPVDAETERYRLFAAVSSLLLEASRQQPLLVVLDDLHWADTSTLLLLDHVVRAIEPARLMIVGTYRDTDLTAQHPLPDLLAVWRREHLAERIGLGGLSVDDVSALVLDHAAGEDDHRATTFARTLHADTNGNAFFVREVLLHLRQLGAIGPGTDLSSLHAAAGGLPEGVREVIGRRLAALSEACQRMLTAAAVIGAELDADVVQRVLDLTDDELYDALDEATDARVLVERPDAVGRYGFSHVLVREVLYEGLSSIRRARLHRAVGEALEALRPSGHRPVAAMAHHFIEATPVGDVGQAIRYAREAASLDLEQLAYEDAVQVLERTLELIDEPGEDQSRDQLDLLLELGQAQAHAGHTVGSHATFSLAVERARAMDDVLSMATAVLGLSSAAGGYAITVRANESLVELLEEAIAALPEGEDAVRARLLGRLAVELYYTAEVDRRRALGEEAVALARSLDDPATLLEALSSRAWAVLGIDVDPQVRLAQADEILALAQAIGDGVTTYRTRFLQQQTLLEIGDLVGADAAGIAAAELASQLKMPGFLPWVGAYGAMRLGVAADFDTADEQSTAALDQALAHGTDPEVAMAVLGGQLMALRLFRGGVETFEEPMVTMADELADHPAIGSWLAVLYCELDRPDEARRALDQAMERLAEMPRDATWLVSLWGLAYSAGQLSEPKHSAALAAALTPYADRWCSTTSTVFLGPVALVLGMVEGVLGRVDDATHHLQRALTDSRRILAPAFEALALAELARLGWKGGVVTGPVDPAAEALALCRKHGLHVLGARVAALPKKR